jgi:hypothetical protein
MQVMVHGPLRLDKYLSAPALSLEIPSNTNILPIVYLPLYLNRFTVLSLLFELRGKEEVASTNKQTK